MSTILDSFPPDDLGERLRLAREDRKMTQAVAASEAGMARTTLVAIEKGQRRVRLDELQNLTGIYRTTINELLRQAPIQINLLPQFRKVSESEDATIEHAVSLLNDLVRAEVELEQLLGISRSVVYPPETPILPGNVKLQAEQDALDLRQWLGLGLNPINDIVSLLELQLGARVYVRRLPTNISGLFAFDDAVGPCILLNANHPRDRRANTAGHETGHFMSTRKSADVLDDATSETAREERYANAFGRAFLMPARAVKQKFQDVTAGASSLSRRHIIVLASYFGVSREALVRRLEELGLIKRDSWDWFVENGGITNGQVIQVLGELPKDDHKDDADRPISLRMSMMADEVWRRGLLSEGQLARLLRLDRLELRAMLDGLGDEGSEADGAPKLLA
ncbi:MAG: ImmA/IrrE family metallo-endopeptidase [Blastomonas sp.]|jgi:Zn-dependent peptidase ImmA (M78 family)/transcriptional regulator with XRE-family HTH domain|uniref:helix-turn-helix domain-containing protein n=1 Tax=Blastomonas TaxID=150203 RepID=UPI0006B8933E|nr:MULTISPECIES: XRE family transcriptional regulator [unclassified Blastomonas]AOG01700.1 helix-turn-helix family protein [Blastomonas sp. RAC04]KPF73882.1 transcriptional regulator [Blastomonas sp. AAP25]MCO5792068.1 ImmA/IrrE family metallo-endopeptidase [Blastomonas sp.]